MNRFVALPVHELADGEFLLALYQRQHHTPLKDLKPNEHEGQREDERVVDFVPNHEERHLVSQWVEPELVAGVRVYNRAAITASVDQHTLRMSFAFPLIKKGIVVNQLKLLEDGKNQ